jgi:N-acetylglucosaminyldiphosphoundecaprenol N-acetyl-beta-D-mannosaminyltransferase
MEPASYQVLGVRVHAMTVDDLYATVERAVKEERRWVIGNHNLHSIYLYHRHGEMRRFCDGADYVFIDGMPLVILGRLLGFGLRCDHRFTSADWASPLMQRAAEHGWRVFLLGSRPGVAERAAEALRRAAPALQVATAHGHFDVSPGSSESEAVLSSIREFRPHVLVVGMGMPLQERWINENRDRIEANVIMNLGAVLDYVSGTVPTPPRWLARLGFEWLGRLAYEPRRLWRRYLVEPWFLLPLVLGALVVVGRRLFAGSTPPSATDGTNGPAVEVAGGGSAARGLPEQPPAERSTRRFEEASD